MNQLKLEADGVGFRCRHCHITVFGAVPAEESKRLCTSCRRRGHRTQEQWRRDMILLVTEAVGRWPQFDDPDDPVNGGDLVEWFGAWRKRAAVLMEETT